METPKTRKKETAQEAFKRLREKSKAEMLERKQKIDDAQERAAIVKAAKEKKAKGKNTEELTGKQKEVKPSDEKLISPLKERKVHVQEADHVSTETKPVSPTIEQSFPTLSSPSTHKSEHHAGDNDRSRTEAVQTHSRYRRRQGRCTNCCGGLPGLGPGSARVGCRSQCCCNSGARLRGGSDYSIREILGRNYETRSSSVPSGKSEFSRTSRSVREGCGYPMSSEFVEQSFQGGCGSRSTPDSFLIRSERSRGGCGGCGGSPQPAVGPFQRFPGDQYQHHSVRLINRQSCPSSQLPPCCRTNPPLPACQRQRDPCAKISNPSTKGCCPCGACGGPACTDNPGGGKIDGGCCGGSRPRGLPCKCKCQSCSDYHPLGGCGGQSCGKIYSCAGSGGGRCCFPRNSKRRSGTECCGGADPNCGGCC